MAEDALGDAVETALERWPRDGLPRSPRAWLLTAARRRAIDRFRREANFERKREQMEALAALEREVAAEDEDVQHDIPDERLRLIFTCCHPALAESARVALTLRTLGGLTTTEIARAFLVPETTMAQRLVRAKKKIKAAEIPYRVPPKHLWPERLASVLSVLYLIFNEGYEATSGPGLVRADLSREAIRLARVVVSLAPDEPEAAGLLALMLLHDARRDARTDADGDLVTLDQQDRGCWNRDQIREGEEILRRALAAAAGRVGPYQVQAAISAVHASAESFETTDWAQIELLYGKLYEVAPTPVIELNAAIARSFAEGPDAALAMLDALSEPLDRYQPYWAARADCLRRAERAAEAIEAYGRALELTGNQSERRFFERRLREVRARG